MNKNVSVKRLFFLGDFRNITFESSITDIPDDVLKNRDATALLYSLMLVEIEEARHNYDLLVKDIVSADDVSILLESYRSQTYRDFLESISQGEEEDE